MRLFHKLYANLMGYFWLPCPVCGRMFGGHEVGNSFTSALIIVGDDGCLHAMCVCCDKCGERANEMNRANGFSHYPSRPKQAGRP